MTHAACFGCQFVVVYCGLKRNSWVLLQHLPSFAQAIESAAPHMPLESAMALVTDLSGAGAVVGWRCDGWRQYWPNTQLLARAVFSPNRVAWIINLYINFPADRERHVDMSWASHADWSWVRWDGRGGKPHSLADTAIPVNSHILFSLLSSERVSFLRLAREAVWHRNRIRSEVTRC